MRDEQQMSKWDIWQEGYSCTGDFSRATLLAAGVEAPTFKDACIKTFQNRSDFDATRLSLWACSLFDNPTDARESFG